MSATVARHPVVLPHTLIFLYIPCSFVLYVCSHQLKEQLLLGSEDREKGSILEAVTLAGWLSRGPQLQPALLELLDSAWDGLEKSLDGCMLVSGGSTRRKFMAAGSQ